MTPSTALSAHAKISVYHLQRLAYIYIRQSTLQQVSDHQESQALQYQLTQRATQMGWPAERVRIVDQDLGKSAVRSDDRSGFQALVADMALGKVGILLVTDVSRLARNCADWYQLLDLASLHQTLLCDMSGVYNPRIYDDRLLLGLKGAFSEAQWHLMRQQLHAARLNKARRGELALRLPVGYVRLENGAVVMNPDRQVQQTIYQVFRLFRTLGSVNGVLHHLRREGILFPSQGQKGQAITWNPPRYSRVYQILKLPAYAGVYTFGRHAQELVAGPAKSASRSQQPPEAWAVRIEDAWAGYITWETYLENQRILAENRQKAPFAAAPTLPQGATGTGRALLQGLVYCGRCGRPPHVRYREKPTYVCELDAREQGTPRCATFPHAHVDAAVVDAFLAAVAPGQVEMALAAGEEATTLRQTRLQLAEQQVERARYAALLARTRYEQVDPQMRLVAVELERHWEEKLGQLEAEEARYASLVAEQPAALSTSERAQVAALAADLPALWRAESTGNAVRKQLLRTLIVDVTLDRWTGEEGEAQTRIRIRWQGGACSEHLTSRPKPGHPSNKALVARVAFLAQTHTDERIAAVLNAEGVASFWQLKKIADPAAPLTYWTRRRVHNLRLKLKIPTGVPLQSNQTGPRGDGLLSLKEAARRLNCSPGTVLDWFRRDLIAGHQIHLVSPVWIDLTEANRHRFDGSLSCPDDDMILLADAPVRLACTPQEIARRLGDGRLESWRIASGRSYRWYLRPTQPAHVPADPAGLDPL